MSQINLLPWREELRQVRNQWFYLELGFVVFATLVLILIIHLGLSYLTKSEQNKIAYLQQEEGKIIEKIREIKGLQDSKKDLLNRMEVIQSLQNDRVLIVKLLNAMPRVLPEGIQLLSLTRTADLITVEGQARSNSQISEFLKNLADPQWNGLFYDIRLTEVATDKTGQGLNFKAQFQLSPALQKAK